MAASTGTLTAIEPRALTRLSQPNAVLSRKRSDVHPYVGYRDTRRECSTLQGAFGRVRCGVVAERQPNQKPVTNIGAKIVLGVLGLAVLAAAIAITVVLLQDDNSGSATAPTAPVTPTTGAEVPAKKVFDKSALEGDRGIKKILIENYGMQADQIHRVDCPAGQAVEVGNMFACTVQIGDDTTKEKLVDVKVIDDNGQYEVGPPRDK